MRIRQLKLIRVFVPAALVWIAWSIYSNITLFYSTLAAPTIYHKDFLNHYVLGRATLLGINPYTKISELPL